MSFRKFQLAFVITLLAWVFPVVVFADTLTVQVSTSLDNGYNVSNNTIFISGTPVFTGGKDVNGNLITAGFRFPNITIPQGSTIQSATIDWQNSWGGDYGAFVKTRIYGEAADSSVAFSSSNLPRNRARTTAFSVYNSSSQSIAAGTWMSTTTLNKPPDIGPVIQEIINRPGWNSGNALSLLVLDNGSNNDWWWEFRSYAAGAASAPKLTVIYTASGATPIPTPTSTPTPTPTSAPAPTNTPTPTPTPTPTSSPSGVNIASFTTGKQGFIDNISHGMVRTSSDKTYFFAGLAESSPTLRAYWTPNAGLPASGADITGSASVTDTAAILTADAVYDGGNIVHVLVNNNAGVLKDFPFDLSTNTFKSPITIATGNPTVSGNYIGTQGVSGMIDRNDTLHISYWSAANHITYRSYTYNTATNVLTLVEGPTQVDTAGSSNHPLLVVSPVDGLVTVQWVSEATSPARILSRTRTAANLWTSIQQASTGNVWVSTNAGINIDQGPVMVIDSFNTKHMVYMENFDATGDYGRMHYVTQAAGSNTWIDTPTSFYSHASGIAINSGDELYILGHGHPENTNAPVDCRSMLNMCYITKPAVGGSWSQPILMLKPSGSDSLDASASVKWGVVGWNRPETVEVAYFAALNGSYQNTQIYYGRITSNAPTATPTPTPTPTPVPTYTLSGNVYVDSNENGVKDIDESGYSGALVSLVGKPDVTTDQLGNYIFSDVTAGTYTETLTVPTGYHATTLNPVSVSVSTDTTQHFGIAVAPTSTPTPTPSGNYAIHLDGLDDTASTSGIYASSSETQTFEAWVKPLVNNAYGIVMSTRNDADNQGWIVELRNGQAELWIADSSGTDRNLLHSGVTMTANTWYHIAATYNASTQNGQVFVNGVPSATGAMGVLTQGPKFILGTFGGGGFTVYKACDCDIDEVRISKGVLYTGSFTPPSLPFTPDANTLLVYHFDEGNGQVSVNSAAGGNTLTFGSSVNTELTDPSWVVSTAPLNAGVPTPTATSTPTPTATPTPTPVYTLSGTVYVDSNANSVQDPGENGFANATVELQTLGAATTNEFGVYTFANLTSGTYTASLTVPAGYMTTTTNPVQVPVSSDTTQHFGITLAPTNTPTPTPTVTPTPTATPTPTPTPAGPFTVTKQISASTDDVNQDNGNLSMTSSTLWVGNGQSTSVSFTGLRFTNITIPKDATITSAHIEFYVPQTSWITRSFSIYAHALGNSPTFSSNNRPSQRTLTAASVAYSSNNQWNANSWISLSEMKTVIQEVVNRSDWTSGNSVSIILKGTGSAYGRSFVTSYNGSVINSPKLIITYQ